MSEKSQLADGSRQLADGATPSLPAANRQLPTRIGLGVVLVALPVGAGYAAWQLKEAADQRDQKLEKRFAYDASPLRQIDPAMVGYREVGQIRTGVAAPTCMAISSADGRLLVGSEGMVRVLDATGMPVTSFAVTGTPECLAVGQDGSVYVGMKDHVEVYGSDGERKAVWASLGKGAYITCLAVWGEDVWVANAGRRVVLRCTPDGRVEVEIGKEDAARGVPGLVVPSPYMDVAVTANGSVWVANPGRHQLELYSRDGELQRTVGKWGTSVDAFLGCCNPSQFALLSDGSIITAEKGIPRVKQYAPDGHLVSVVVGPEAFGQNHGGLNVATNAAGQVLVLEPGTDTVRLFARADAAVSL